MRSTHRDEGWKGSLWAFTFKGKKINTYLQKIDLRMPGVPKHSQLLRGTAARTGVTQGRHKQGHGLMRIPEACGSEEDKGMASAEDGIKSEKKSFELSQKRG